MKIDNIRNKLSDEKKLEYQFDIYDYNQSLETDLGKIIKGLRGKFIAKSENLFLRLFAISFIFVGISGLVYELNSGVKIDYSEFISCLIIIGLGLFMIALTIGFLYFDDMSIKSVGLFRIMFWSIDKEQIQKVELADVKHSFSKMYWIYITSENTEYMISMDHRMISHIERVSGKPINTMVNRIEYLSPPISFKSVFRILLLLVDSFVKSRLRIFQPHHIGCSRAKELNMLC